MTAFGWETDPHRLVFQFSRYKFVARMLQGKGHALEVGCADGCGARIVRQHVGRVTAIDCDPISIQEAKEHASPRWPVEFHVCDFLKNPIKGFDAVYSLDVFEHIAEEQQFLKLLHDSAPVCIIGTPSLESQMYASEISKAGHVNCVSGDRLRILIQQHWRHVFLFSMNDEVVHTGFSPMAHYLLALAVR